MSPGESEQTASGRVGAIPAADPTPALRLSGVGLQRGERRILDDVDWTVNHDERWAVLGPNGSGKSTLVRIASLYLHPTAGQVEVLGGVLGRVDVRRHRLAIGLAAASLADQLRPNLSAVDVVMCAKNAALEPWWHTYDDDDRARARAQLERLGCGDLADREFGTCSSGERQRVLLARTLMTDPGLLLLDEPTAALDLGGREQLVATLDTLASDPAAPPVVLITHHVEEIPASFTHALLLKAGRVLFQGEIDQVLTSETLSECFGLGIRLARQGGRWQAFGG